MCPVLLVGLGQTGNQQLILDLLTDSFRVRGLMTGYSGILTVWVKTSQTSENTPRLPAHLPVTFDRTFKKSPKNTHTLHKSSSVLKVGQPQPGPHSQCSLPQTVSSINVAFEFMTFVRVS